jgi:hypothetical protein
MLRTYTYHPSISVAPLTQHRGNQYMEREKQRAQRDSDTYGTNSNFPHTELLRRSLLAQESFSSVVTVQSCLCSRSSSIAEREPEPFVGMRPESHQSAFLFLHSFIVPSISQRVPKARSGTERTQVVAIMNGGLHDCDCWGPGCHLFYPFSPLLYSFVLRKIGRKKKHFEVSKRGGNEILKSM